MTNTLELVRDSLVLVAVRPRSWSGTTTLDRSLLPDKGSTLPPHQLVKKEELRLINPNRLRANDAFRKAVERYLGKLGFELFTLRAVPAQQAAAVQAELQKFADQFETTVRAEIRTHLVDWYDEWEQAQAPEWRPILRQSRLDVRTVVERFSFSHRLLRVARPSNDPDDPLNREFEEELGGALMSLLRSVAREADEIWAESFRGRLEIQQATLRPVVRLIEKLKAFAMIDLRLLSTVRVLEASLAGLPRQGRLGQVDTQLVGGIVRLLADPPRLLEHGAAATSNGNPPASQGPASPQLPLLGAAPPDPQEPTSGDTGSGIALRPMFRRASADPTARTGRLA